MPHRPFTRRQQSENKRFLAALRRTGNVRLTCRELGVHRGTYTKRRARCPAFATAWDATLAAAHAAFKLAGGERLPDANPPLPLQGRGTARSAVKGPLESPERLRTRGGEPVIVRQANGRLQLRRAPPGRMTEAARRLILATVEETNNLRLAAAAAGFAHSSVIVRVRRDPDLARRVAVARRIGADRVMWQIMHPPGRPEPEDIEFAHLPMPPTTVEQCLLQLRYHCPDGAFQQHRWRIRPLPRPFAEHRPRIVATLNAWRRAEWHKATGKWPFDGE